MAGFRRVLVNAGWNLSASLLPLLAALVAMPYLARQLGTERFGVLMLAWVLIGYFGLFDFGVGRALTQMVAARQAQRDGGPHALGVLGSSGLALAGAAGVFGAMLVAAAALAAGRGLALPGVPDALRDEAVGSLLIIALGIPPTVGTAAARGLLEGLQRFRLLTAIRVPTGVLSFLAPCVAVAVVPSLVAAVAALVAMRWVMLLVHLWPCRRDLGLDLSLVQPASMGPMLRTGGWMSVSNIVGPLIVYADRFVIGALVSPTALAHYAVPFELVSRLLVFPTALAGALFPALSAAGARDPAGATALRRSALGLTLACVIPVAALGWLAAAALLQAWMGPDFATHGTRVMQWLLVGFAFNAAAQIPFAALQGHGLARQTALLHLVELPFYLVLLAALVASHGIEGAALAWTLRGVVDYLVLTVLLQRAERRRAAAA